MRDHVPEPMYKPDGYVLLADAVRQLGAALYARKFSSWYDDDLEECEPGNYTARTNRVLRTYQRKHRGMYPSARTLQRVIHWSWQPRYEDNPTAARMQRRVARLLRLVISRNEVAVTAICRDTGEDVTPPARWFAGNLGVAWLQFGELPHQHPEWPGFTCTAVIYVSASDLNRFIGRRRAANRIAQSGIKPENLATDWLDAYMNSRRPSERSKEKIHDLMVDETGLELSGKAWLRIWKACVARHREFGKSGAKPRKAN